MKHFTNEKWNKALARQNWSEINKTPDLNEKVEIFNKMITMSLDEVAPYRTFTIRTNHKFGLSPETKELMKKREAARRMIQKAEKMKS